MSASTFPFPCEPIPKIDASSPEVLQRLKADLPVVITNSKFCDSALCWSPDYLVQNLECPEVSVYSSERPNKTFMFHDETKNTGSYAFDPPTKKTEMSLPEFMQEYRNPRTNPPRSIYLQQGLHEKVSAVVTKDFTAFDWQSIFALQKQCGWGNLTTNMLFVGQQGVTTPLHYDEQENLFVQLHGTKRCILADPKYFNCVYPYRVGHPCDRQSQVDFYNVDYTKFPKVKDLQCVDCVLEPGDVLYIPKYWFHHIISQDETVSVNFWFVAGNDTDISFPLSPSQQMAMSRNIEKMLGNALQSGSDLSAFMCNLVQGRYDSASDENHRV